MPTVSLPLLLLASVTCGLALWQLRRHLHLRRAHRHARRLTVSRETIARLRRAEDSRP